MPGWNRQATPPFLAMAAAGWQDSLPSPSAHPRAPVGGAEWDVLAGQTCTNKAPAGGGSAGEEVGAGLIGPDNCLPDFPTRKINEFYR